MVNGRPDPQPVSFIPIEASASESAGVAPACAVLVTATGEADVVASLLSELSARASWRPARGAVIVWQFEPSVAELDDEPPPVSGEFRELTDAAVLDAGVTYFVPQHRRIWFEGKHVRVAPRSVHEHHPIDRLLLSLAEGWGSGSVSLLAVSPGDDGECGLRIIRAVGGAALRRSPLRAAAPAIARWQGVSGGTLLLEDAAPGEADRVPGAAFRASRALSFPPLGAARARAACEAAVQAARGRGCVQAWLPGCKTGGIAYATAMLLRDEGSRCPSPLEVAVFGSDDDEEALAVASRGRYPSGAALGLDAELRGRHTVDEGGATRVAEAVRASCTFSRHELLRDPPLSSMDLVICHRVFDGVPAARRPELVERLHRSLRPSGLLLSLDHTFFFVEELFEPVDGGFLRAREVAARQRFLPPLLPTPSERAREESALAAEASADLVRRDGSAAVSVGPAVSAGPAASVGSAVSLEAVLHTIGLPLLVCDPALRVRFVSQQAQAAFGFLPADGGAELLALAPRLPSGFDLVQAARDAVEQRQTRELSTRTGRRTYLARVAPGAAGVSIVFTDVTQLEVARAQALSQRHRDAAVARLADMALGVSEPRPLYEEALGMLFGSIPACSAGIIVELGSEPGEYRVMASRGLGADPLRTLRGVGDAGCLLDAVVERGCVVSQGGERAVWGKALAGAPAAGRIRRPRAGLPAIGRGLGCPISGGGGMLGVIALYGRRAGIEDVDHQHFARAVASALGDAVARHRTRRRLTIELEVSRALAVASDLPSLSEGLRRALGDALGVDAIELWAARSPLLDGWSRLIPALESASPPPPWPSSPLGRAHSGVVFRASSGGEGELSIAIPSREAPPCLLRVRGRALRAPDAEVSEGLKSIARMLGEFLDRLRVVELSRHSEASFRQKSAELEALYASLPVGVSIHDYRGTIRHCNRHLGALEAPLGSERARPLKRLYAEVVPLWVSRVLATGEPVLDVELSISEGEQAFFWLCNFAPIRDAEGRLHGASAVVQDITALKRVEATLREADQQKDDFLAMLGHELRNPMAAIRSATELLGRIEQPSLQLLRLQSIFERQTLQTTNLIDGLLDVARVARGKVELQLAPVQVVELVRQVVDDRRQQFQGRALELRLPDEELWVSADRVRMLQVLDNLLSNAIKFTSATGSVRVEVKHGDELGLIRVEDDGLGIEAELLPRIFEPFRQGRASVALAQGLGLGLALVKGLVDLHGFRLQADSAGSGRGASFQIEFPVILAPESMPPESRVDTRGLELLLVEDNADVAETLAELLVGAGHRVEHRGSAEEALELLRRSRPDVVLCDIGLPGMDGLELATRLRADPDLGHLKLVAMTGFGDATTKARIENAGFDRHLIKPVAIDALRHCLARVAAMEPRRSSRR